jgi:hypothetical protein
MDTNIVLDFLWQREPFFQDAELLFQAIDGGEVVGYVTATRDAQGFLSSPIPVLSVQELWRQVIQQNGG